MSEFPITSPIALVLAAGDNYGVRHLDTPLFLRAVLCVVQDPVHWHVLLKPSS